MPCSCSGIKMIIWRVGLRKLETPIPHPRIVVGTQRKSCHYPQDLRSFTKNRNLEIGSTMFMVWVSSWNKCDAARHHKLNRAYGDVNFSTNRSVTPLLLQRTHAEENMTRHQERQQTIVSTRNVPLRKRRWHTTRRVDGNHLPTPQAYRSFRKNRHWAIGSQAFKALTFILGVGTKNRCDRSTIAQSELCNRWRSVQNTNFHPGR